MMNAIDALSWCRDHAGTIRFHADGTVTVEAYGRAKRAVTVGDAMTALRACIRTGGQ
jgi:hypothetical protein